MKDVVGYEGLYAVTSCGKVWSYKSQKFLKPKEDKDGYLIIVLYKNKIRKDAKIHRLVSQAYIPNPEGKPQVNHRDEDKSNNCVNNLEWATAKENTNYGTRNKRAGEANRNSRGVPVYCVELDKVFLSARGAARELGLQQSNITACVKGKHKTCGGYHWQYTEN